MTVFMVILMAILWPGECQSTRWPLEPSENICAFQKVAQEEAEIVD